MPTPRRRWIRKWPLTTVIAVALVTSVSTAVIASHQFDDVPDSNQFHGSISWLADNGVTVGCNDTGTDFCPTDNVTRQQMASFMRRFAQTLGVAGQEVTDTSDPVTVDSTTFVELASIDVTPKAEANVVLNAHFQIEVDLNAGTQGRFAAVIASGSCDGTVLGSGGWRATNESAGDLGFQSTTVSLTGFDQISSDTTYVLCAEKFVGGSVDGAVNSRGMTATWSPTA